MVNLELLAVMFAIGYIAYVFVAESVNPFRRFDLRRNHKRNHKTKLKRQQFLHRCGLLAGGVFVVSPVILALQPVEGGLPSQIRLCLITAGLILLALLLIQAAIYLMRWTTRQENGAIDLDDEPLPVSNSGHSTMLLGMDDQLQGSGSARYGESRLLDSLPLDAQDVGEDLDNIMIDADGPVGTDPKNALDDAERQLSQADYVDHEQEDLYGSDFSQEQLERQALERQAMDNSISRIRSVFRPEASISDGVVVEADLTTANDAKYVDSKSQNSLPHRQLSSLSGSGLSQNRTITGTTDSDASSSNPTLETAAESQGIDQSLDRITEQLADTRTNGELPPTHYSNQRGVRHDQTDQQSSDSQDEKLARQAAEKLIEQQRQEITRGDELRVTIEEQLTTIQAEIKEQKMQLERSRKTARNATLLARSAALKQQQAHEMARQEKLVREKIEQKAQKAVAIAKNAITALALEEQKNSKASVKASDWSAAGK